MSTTAWRDVRPAIGQVQSCCGRGRIGLLMESSKELDPKSVTAPAVVVIEVLSLRNQAWWLCGCDLWI